MPSTAEGDTSQLLTKNLQLPLHRVPHLATYVALVLRTATSLQTPWCPGQDLNLHTLR